MFFASTRITTAPWHRGGSHPAFPVLRAQCHPDAEAGRGRRGPCCSERPRVPRQLLFLEELGRGPGGVPALKCRPFFFPVTAKTTDEEVVAAEKTACGAHRCHEEGSPCRAGGPGCRRPSGDVRRALIAVSVGTGKAGHAGLPLAGLNHLRGLWSAGRMRHAESGSECSCERKMWLGCGI